LEALVAFLDSDGVNIPVSGINIGPVHKKDVLRANVMAEKGVKKVGFGLGVVMGWLLVRFFSCMCLFTLSNYSRDYTDDSHNSYPNHPPPKKNTTTPQKNNNHPTAVRRHPRVRRPRRPAGARPGRRARRAHLHGRHHLPPLRPG
jgi:hypothetical protein